MPFIHAVSAPTFELPALTVTGLAAPSRGARESCVWRLTLAPGAPGTPHSLDREEIFVGLSGCARATLGAEVVDVGPGDTLIVPAGQSFALANPGGEPFVAVAVLPVGGRACVQPGESFSPPWTV
jgi:mannose-6-phosphate isomerase-like protein (cupin superfamily)